MQIVRKIFLQIEEIHQTYPSVTKNRLWAWAEGTTAIIPPVTAERREHETRLAPWSNGATARKFGNRKFLIFAIQLLPTIKTIAGTFHDGPFIWIASGSDASCRTTILPWIQSPSLTMRVSTSTTDLPYFARLP